MAFLGCVGKPKRLETVGGVRHPGRRRTRGAQPGAHPDSDRSPEGRDARNTAGACRRHAPSKEARMVLATGTIEDFERFWGIFSTKGAEKRKQYGSNGAHVFRDPNDENRVWVVFDWDQDGWQSFIADPDMPAIFGESGLQGPPKAAEFLRSNET
jgi:hypothetical protein